MGSVFRHHYGGIASLACLIEEHGEAIDYDLMTLTHYRLDDLGESLSWGSLRTFVNHLPAGSAYFRDKFPEHSTWATGEIIAYLLADIEDSINNLRYEQRVAHSGKKGKQPQQYPRPWLDKKMKTK